MSFVEQDDIIELGEAVMASVWKLIGHEIPTPMPRMTYADAMARYGSDKPDLRFGQELTDCTEFFKDTTFRVFQAPYVGAVVMPGGASQPRKQLDAWQDFAKQRGAKGLAYVLVGEDGELGGPGRQEPDRREREGLAKHVGASNGDCIFFAAVPAKPHVPCWARPGSEIGRRCELIDESAWSFLWVLDAPLFEPTSEAEASGDVAVGSGAWTQCTTRSPRPRPSSSTPSTPTRVRPWPTPTTWCATATRSAAARSVSTAGRSRSGSSR
jgi:aspartyl-tRNA synthetase